VLSSNKVQGKRDGMSVESTKKLYTAYNKMTAKGKKPVQSHAVYKKLQELHNMHGFANPVKLSCITENKAFWKLDAPYQINVLKLCQWEAIRCRECQ